MTSVAYGASGNYAISVSNGTDFDGSLSGASLSGGTDAVILYDSGTVTVSINGVAMPPVSWNQSSTTASLAAAMSSAINQTDGSAVTASVVPSTTVGGVVNTVSLQSAQTGSASWPVVVTVVDNNPSLFPTPSFGATGSMNCVSGVYGNVGVICGVPTP